MRDNFYFYRVVVFVNSPFENSLERSYVNAATPVRSLSYYPIESTSSVSYNHKSRRTTNYPFHRRYLYIYMCVCVCVCVIDISSALYLYIYIYIYIDKYR